MADEILPEGKEGGKQDPVVKLNFAKKAQEKPKEPEQKEAQEDDEPRDGDGDPYDWEWEIASFREVFDFFSNFFEAVGYGDAKLDETGGHALGYLFRLLEKRARLLQP